MATPHRPGAGKGTLVFLESSARPGDQELRAGIPLGPCLPTYYEEKDYFNKYIKKLQQHTYFGKVRHLYGAGRELVASPRHPRKEEPATMW